MKPGFGNIEAVFRGGGQPKPIFLSAEIGLIDAYTIDMLFDIALNETKIPDAVDLIPTFSGGATQVYDRTITGTHLYTKTGMSDWYLPSLFELNQMYSNLKAYGVGDFSLAGYWSSSESGVPATNAYKTQFTDGNWSSVPKTENNHRVRACRSFISQKVYSLRDVGPSGGWIFYINGTTYYEAASVDQSTGIAWSNITNIAVGTNPDIGTGQANTTAIINQVGHTTSAAKLCNDLVIGRAITFGETGTIQYVPNTNNTKKLQSLTRAKINTFTENVTNNVPLPPLVDLDGNQYTTVIIGNQEWTIENFRCTKYADGSNIINGVLYADWVNAVGAYCSYNNNPDMLETYGVIYSQPALNNIKGLAYLEKNNIQENGWRIPTYEDYNALISYLGGSELAGIALRDTSWGIGSTNSSGFKALPGGYRKYDASYLEEGSSIYLANKNATDSWCYISVSGITNYGIQYSPALNGYYIRLVKDV
jgi:uncharacterized protein (TIGR02145 family)